MLTLSSSQQALVDASSKRSSWLFTLTTTGATTYYWSTKDFTFNAQAYDNRVIPDTFTGIELNRSGQEDGIIAPSKVQFSISNDDDTFTVADLPDADLRIDLVLSDWSDEEIIASWKFKVITANEIWKTISLSCEDFLTQYLEGDYPNTKLLSQLSPSDFAENDNLCIPVPFGTVYIPIRSLYVDQSSSSSSSSSEVSGRRYYVLGPSTYSYTLEEIRSPEDWDSVSIWDNSSDYPFNEYTHVFDGDSYHTFQPIIADSDEDGVADACGLWFKNGVFLDPYVKFSRSDLVSMTNPADIIEYVLEDMGIDSSDIDSGSGSSFETAEATYNSWGLEFNGAFFYTMPRREAIALLLNMCHSTLRITDKVELHVLSKTSQMTFTDANINKTGEVGETTFSVNEVTQELSDYAHIAYAPSGDPQGILYRAKVPTKSTYDYASSDVLEIPFVGDSSDAQRIGILYFQRKFGVKNEVYFEARDDAVVLQPDDVITINDTAYGGNYACVVEGIKIESNLNIIIGAVRMKYDLDDWGDLSVSDIVVSIDDSITFWQPVICGPSGPDGLGRQPNALRGALRVGEEENYIFIDPVNMLIKVVEGSQERITIGKVASDEYGLLGKDVSGNTVLKIDSTEALIAGWNFDDEKIYTSNIIIDSANERIRSANYVSGYSGFTLEADLLEVGNIVARGEISTIVMKNSALSGVAGSLVVPHDADVLAADMTASDSSTLTIKGNVTFSVSDCLRIKDADDDEWFTVTNTSSAPTYTVTRDRGGSYSSNNNPAWKKGAAVLNFGASGDGLIFLTSSLTNGPFLGVYTTAGSPWGDLNCRVRVGNLNGFAGYSSDLYGFGAYFDASNYLLLDPTNGLRIAVSSANAITIKSGGNLLVESGGDIVLSDGGNIEIAVTTASSGITWKSGSSDVVFFHTSSVGVTSLTPNTTGYMLRFGISEAIWDDVYIEADDGIYLNLDPHYIKITSTELKLYWYGLSYENTLTFDDTSGIVMQGAMTFKGLFTIAAGSTNKLRFDTNNDLYLYDGSIVLPASEYLNFGGTLGSGGYGIRDNSGDIEVKDSGEDWFKVGRVIVKETTGYPTGYNGMICVNNYDNKISIVGDSTWRDIVTW